MVVILSTFCSVSLAEVTDDGEIIILDDETEASFDEIALEITDDFDLPVEDIPEEIDLLDADLLALEPQTLVDSIETDDVVSNSAQGNYGVDLESEGYVTNINPFYRKHYWGECTWYCWGRAYEKCGVQLSWSTNDVFGNAKEWYNNAKAWADTHDVDYSVGTEPRTNSIAVSTSGYYGHVVFIEKIEDGQVYYSECNGDAGAHTYGEGSKPLSNLPYVGYIYLRGVVASGQCGDDVYWDLYEDKVLEIHGSGAMWDFYESINGGSPWYDYCYVYRDDGSLIDRIEVQPGVTYIGANAFFEQEFSQIEIADSVGRIGKFAFCRSEGFDSIVLPDKIRSIPDCAFEECDLESIKLPGNLEVIESGAFFQCRSLESIEFPDTLRTIGNMAFAVTGLESIHIPRNVEQVDSRAFWASTYDSPKGTISRITVDSNNKSYLAKDNVLYSKNMDTLVYCAPQKTGKLSVSASVRYIMASAFDCSRLTEVVLPEGILRIDDGAFAGAENLKKLNLPASLDYISSDAFRVGDYEEWGGLTNVTLYAPYGSYAHKYCRANDAKHNEYVYVNNYIITMNLSKTGSNGRVTLRKGEKIQLIPVSKKGNLTIKSCKTNYSKVAKVNNKGVVTAVGKGESKITVQPKGLKAMTLTVKVIDPYTPTGVKLNKSGTVKLAIGKTLKLKATVSPDTAETTLTWSSSNSKIAKVSKNGKVTGLKKGTATITVKTKNGKTAKVKIKVEKGSGGGGGGGGW